MILEISKQDLHATFKIINQLVSIHPQVLKNLKFLLHLSEVISLNLFTNKTDRHDIPEILLKVALITITLTLTPKFVKNRVHQFVLSTSN